MHNKFQILNKKNERLLTFFTSGMNNNIGQILKNYFYIQCERFFFLAQLVCRSEQIELQEIFNHPLGNSYQYVVTVKNPFLMVCPKQVVTRDLPHTTSNPVPRSPNILPQIFTQNQQGAIKCHPDSCRPRGFFQPFSPLHQALCLSRWIF